jgi:hypothetical protein
VFWLPKVVRSLKAPRLGTTMLAVRQLFPRLPKRNALSVGVIFSLLLLQAPLANLSSEAKSDAPLGGKDVSVVDGDDAKPSSRDASLDNDARSSPSKKQCVEVGCVWFDLSFSLAIFNSSSLLLAFSSHRVVRETTVQAKHFLGRETLHLLTQFYVGG